MLTRRFLGAALAAVVLAAVAGTISGRLLSADPPPSAAEIHRARQIYLEAKSAPIVQQKLALARASARQQGLKAELQITGVSGYELKDITGYKPRPADQRKTLAKLQNAKVGFKLAALAEPLPPRFDVREEIRKKFPNVTWGMRFQDSCGSCWAFAAVAAYEGNYLFQGTFGPDIDPSEQDLLNCTSGNDCSGGLIDNAFKVMQSQGAANRGSVPYFARKDFCRDEVARPFHAKKWGFVDDEFVDTDKLTGGNVEKLKRALRQYGAIGVAMFATPEFQHFKSSLWEDDQQGTPNHAVVLVGWDDAKAGGAWLMKNSWGSSWGGANDPATGGGYIWIKYGSNRIGYDACWVEAAGLPPPPTPTPTPTPIPDVAPQTGANAFQVFVGDKLLDYKDTLIAVQNLGKDAAKVRVSLIDGKSQPVEVALDGLANQTLSVKDKFPGAVSCSGKVEALDSAAIRVTAFWQQSNGTLTVVPMNAGSTAPAQPLPAATSRTDEIQKRIDAWPDR